MYYIISIARRSRLKMFPFLLKSDAKIRENKNRRHIDEFVKIKFMRKN